jgi:hypothetical protein
VGCGRQTRGGHSFPSVFLKAYDFVLNELRARLDPTERERESAKLLLFYIFFLLLDPNTPKCKRANATVILLIMD